MTVETVTQEAIAHNTSATIPEQNKVMVQRWVEEGWNQGNLALVQEMYASEYALHDPTEPNLQGIPAFQAFVQGLRSAFPDFHMVLQDLTAEEDRVVWRFTVTATHLGFLKQVPPTGKAVQITGLVQSRFENGLWKEDHSQWDVLGMLQQIGVIPLF
ncbi:ester cyclase [Deinococcus roseus]|uniref:Ester cyclase n=1 Tax=Deinococcus roseus TaxID=392414 RepID=A0ABQ2D3T6_9DEIO|nr:ester cyclase [Deinococcus roseus]GGJ44995.1 hypothetical protein GCM10008938_34030 [Deinococcus roseus]